ncbi:MULTISPECIES: YheC/YheD family protein [Brevibacillus]|jgi:Glutathione synthase/Ribosomal protein S6 modification enzyme (glutaminyl transferase)|uniref:ATP-grasp domain-containing protein n=1 Tax=Brevibacillus parabrevis TaxID=54914 RepID=A0A4Y3PPJ4_BREPA|nr:MULTISPECIES: YheC/YheD family protein [Brevibacillus]MDH6349410.1 glutathione synthase/RimK-type ligase-like ATP-grasp enzyme [Brevibacillus sp. 1238]MDR5002560.1 YheC/YheD family protein [Brevibacillus parabrevis]NRQ52435.1 YheC/YheD family protein [Brevibacillus sp. HD1.4A]RNB96113.1 YheC/YheD family protein [Brevibacillus parabrevis]WDV97863.1 YheC/YheD family protein [Brevibacillus parabrevis]
MPFHSSKWALHNYYSRSASLRRYLPPTAIFSRKTLRDYMSRYSSVFIKPDNEHMGRGVIKAWKEKGRYTFVKEKGSQKHASSIDQLYKKVRQKSGSTRHIIQKTIPLAKVHGRRFDIRVMMMRNAAGKWEFAAMLAKVAGKDSIITNVRRGGGYALKVSTALAPTLSKAQIERVTKRLIQLGYEISAHFNQFKRRSELGIDFAVDRSGRIYLIEVNHEVPSHVLFLRLKDKAPYRNIRRLARAYRNRKK